MEADLVEMDNLVQDEIDMESLLRSVNLINDLSDEQIKNGLQKTYKNLENRVRFYYKHFSVINPDGGVSVGIATDEFVRLRLHNHPHIPHLYAILKDPEKHARDLKLLRNMFYVHPDRLEHVISDLENQVLSA